MADRISKEKRSWVMSRVKGRDTGPELAVRRAAHALGLRFRLNRRDLPGRPDVVFPKHRVALFVHGCFWHQHPGCRRARVPEARPEYWIAKLRRNVERDAAVGPALEALGWRPVVIWECEIKDPANLAALLRARVHDPSAACEP